jgi:hypothetical protein
MVGSEAVCLPRAAAATLGTPVQRQLAQLFGSSIDRLREKTRMDTWAVEAANGVTWMRDCLLESGGLARANDRIQARCSAGIRYFSAIGRAVPLDQVEKVALEISKAEGSETRNECSGPLSPLMTDAAISPRMQDLALLKRGAAFAAVVSAALVALIIVPNASADSTQAAFAAENATAMAKMMAGMDVKPSGDIDRDFAAMMIPHHQGAIDMALAELRYGRNEPLRRIAQEIIVEQQQEIAAMNLALDQPLPPSTPAPTQAMQSDASESITPVPLSAIHVHNPH